MEQPVDTTGTRSLLANLDEYRVAVAEIATRARRTLSIYTTDLEPQIYDTDLFLEPVKRLVLARSHARLRVLISNPGRVSRDGNRFMMMARRLTSYIDLRNVAPEYRSNPCSFIVADDKAIVYRQQATKWEGIVEFDDASVVKRYLAYFDEVWAGSLIQPFDILGQDERSYWLVHQTTRRNVPKIRAFREWLLAELTLSSR